MYPELPLTETIRTGEDGLTLEVQKSFESYLSGSRNVELPWKRRPDFLLCAPTERPGGGSAQARRSAGREV